MRGGLVSVALSVTSVTTVPRSYLAACPWSPDFPRNNFLRSCRATVRPGDLAREDTGGNDPGVTRTTNPLRQLFAGRENGSVEHIHRASGHLAGSAGAP